MVKIIRINGPWLRSINSTPSFLITSPNPTLFITSAVSPSAVPVATTILLGSLCFIKDIIRLKLSCPTTTPESGLFYYLPS